MATPSKRRRNDELPAIDSAEDLRDKLRLAIRTHESAEVALLYLIREYKFDSVMFQQALKGDGLNVSFSNVKYESIAEFVGLDPVYKFEDALTFELHRSRIPTALYRRIIEDIDAMVMQYGPPDEHKTEESTSRFFSPIFNHLVPLFTYAFRNLSESTVEGRIATSGRIKHYFVAFGTVSFLFIEVKLKILADRLHAIAQVIAECGACNWQNSQFSSSPLPVYGVLCDGSVFEFFKFQDDKQSLSFTRGCFPGDPRVLRKGLPLSNPSLSPDSFIRNLRPICETIFDLMLQGFISSLVAFRDRSMRKSNMNNKPRKGLTKWEEALESAHDAYKKCREADKEREDGSMSHANALVQEGMDALACSVALIPLPWARVSVMSGWDDQEVEKA